MSAEKEHWLPPEAALQRFQPQPHEFRQASVEAEVRTRYGVRISDLNLLLGAEIFSEIIEPPAMYRLPNTAPWLLGLINLRGNLLPIYDLNLLFGMASTAPKDKVTTRLLILDQGEQTVGFFIDGFPLAVRPTTALSQLPPLPSKLAAHIASAYWVEERVWLEFNHAGFFQALAQVVA